MQNLRYIERFVDGMKVVEILARNDAQSDVAEGTLRESPGASTSLSNPGYTFLCMHGYGANAFDLAGLSQHIAMPEGTRFLFPDGIVRIDLGYGAGYEGRAWFPIDFAEIERIRREGGLRDLSKSLPAGMAEARDRLIDAMQKLECDPAKTIIGGFSQGAMLATEIMLQHEQHLAGLVIFSGTLVNRTGWEAQAKAKFKDAGKTLNFIQSHGRFDPVLPFQAAERLHTLLSENGGVGSLIAFEGQHEIPAEVIDGTNRWLSRICG